MKENVAIIFDGLYGGGAERIAGLLSVYLAERFNVYLFLERTDKFVYDYRGKIIDCGKSGTELMEYNVMLAKKSLNIHYSISFMEFFNYINIKTKQDDIVIISERCNLTCAAPHSFYDELMIRRLYKYADHIVAISDGVRRGLIDKYGIAEEKITTINNFTDKESIVKKSEESNFAFRKKAGKLIVSIGRLEEQKNHRRLLCQFKNLYDDDKDVQLVIIGNGSLYHELTELVRQLEIDDAVTFFPYMSNPFSILKQADVFVLPSRYEGLGNVLIEAMCLGIPIIAVDCPSGPAELLSDSYNSNREITAAWKKHERGILVTPSPSEDDLSTTYLSEAIEYLLSSDEYRMRVIQNQKEYMSKYSNEKIFLDWVDVFNKAKKTRCDNKWNYEKKLDVIYGAGRYCRRLIREMKEENRDIYAIMVSDLHNNPAEVEGIPVYDVAKLKDRRNDVNVILGVYDFDSIEQICHLLKDNEFAYVERPMMFPEKE